jgi:hypothetical protein
MAAGAKITSTEAVRYFKVAMLDYEAQLRDTVAQLELDLRRVLDWVDHERPRYWAQAARKASDALVAARRALERAELSIRPEDKRSCYEQKLAYDQAKRRLGLTEKKVRDVRKWRVMLHQEGDDFLGHVGRLNNYLDIELPRAVAALERMAQALDKYTELTSPGAAGAGGAAEEP